MERLTYDFCIGDMHCWQVKGADNLTCERVCSGQGGCRDCPIAKAFDRLAAYEDAMPIERAQELARAETDGRLVVLPCKVGDTVYVTYGEGYRACVVDCVYILANNRVQVRMRHSCTETLWLSDAFGKTVFLTREEAEAALKKREEEDNEKSNSDRL